MEILIVFAVVFVVIFLVMKQKSDRLFEEGKTIKRKDLFYEKRHIFTVKNAPWDLVVKKATSLNIPEAKVTVYPNNGGYREILYKSAYSWNAKLDQIEEGEDANVYQFEFSEYIARSGGLPNMIPMNVMQTAIEKMFLELDPQATVEAHEIKRKTKTL